MLRKNNAHEGLCYGCRGSTWHRRAVGPESLHFLKSHRFGIWKRDANGVFVKLAHDYASAFGVYPELISFPYSFCGELQGPIHPMKRQDPLHAELLDLPGRSVGAIASIFEDRKTMEGKRFVSK